MKKWMHKCWPGIILVFLMTSLFTSCLTLHDAKQIEQTMESPDWKTAYETLLQQALEECKTKQTNRNGFGEYGLYDFDQDSVPELFMKVYEDHVKDDCIRVYDCENNKLIYLDGFSAGRAWVWKTHIPNAVIVVYYGAWKVQGWILKRYENGKFQYESRSEVLAEVHSEGVPWMITEEYPHVGSEYTTTNIQMYGLDDLSGIELYE